MPYSDSSLAYPDIKDVLDKALVSPRGVRVRFESKYEIARFIARANKFRQLARRANKAIYHEGHELHGACVYDTLTIAKKPDCAEVTPIRVGLIAEEM